MILSLNTAILSPGFPSKHKGLKKRFIGQVFSDASKSRLESHNMPDLISLLCIVTGAVDVVYTLALILLVYTYNTCVIYCNRLTPVTAELHQDFKFIVDTNLIAGSQPPYSMCLEWDILGDVCVLLLSSCVSV